MNQIVNVRGLRPNQPGILYCGRAWAGWQASPLGNPFRPGRDGTREEVLERYRSWLGGQITEGNQEVLDALAAIKADSILGCWCFPSRCHCQIIWEEWTRLMNGS